MSIDYTPDLGGDGNRGYSHKRDPSLGKTLKNGPRTGGFDKDQLVELAKKGEARIYRNAEGSYTVWAQTWGERKNISLPDVLELIAKGPLKASAVEGIEVDAPELLEQEKAAMESIGWKLKFVGVKYKNRGCIIVPPSAPPSDWGTLLGTYSSQEAAEAAQNLAMKCVKDGDFDFDEWRTPRADTHTASI